MKRIISVFLTVVIFASAFCCGDVLAKPKKTTKKTTTTTTTTTTTKPLVIVKPKYLKATESLTGVTLSWNKYANADGYVISRTLKRGAWKRIARIEENIDSYVDTGLTYNTLYYYKAKSFKYVNGKRKFSKVSRIVPVYFGPNFYISSFKDSVQLTWQKIEEAKGYNIYFSEDNVKFKLLKNINDNTITSYTHLELKPYKKNYYYYIKAYVNKKVKKKTKKEFIYTSETEWSRDVNSIINGSIDEPKTFYKTIRVQSSTPSTTKTNITSADKKTIKTYNKNYLSNDMSPAERIYNAFMFVHKNVTYASGSLYSQIWSCTYVDAIFNKRLGQCAQYNGAMIEYVNNMGLNGTLIWGYRGTSNSNRWQHFWGEVKLKNGVTYVLETGNYGNDGNWHYFFVPYSQTKKYLKCGEYVSGIY